MFTHEQRLSAVPQLLNYTDDPALDAQTHAWAFKALQRHHRPALAQRLQRLADLVRVYQTD